MNETNEEDEQPHDIEEQALIINDEQLYTHQDHAAEAAPTSSGEQDNFKDGVDVSSPSDYEANSSLLSWLLFSFVSPLIHVGFKKAGGKFISNWLERILQLLRIRNYVNIEEDSNDASQFNGMSHSDIPKLGAELKCKNQFEKFNHSFKTSFEHERKYYSKDGSIRRSHGTLLILLLERVFRWKGFYVNALWRLVSVFASYLCPLIFYVLLESIRTQYVQNGENKMDDSVESNRTSLNGFHSVPDLYSISLQSQFYSIQSNSQNFTSQQNETSNTYWIIAQLPLSNIYFQFLLLVLLIILNIISLICLQHYYYANCKLWLAVRGSLQASIFQKLTRITPTNRSKFQSGEVTNLFTTDSNRLSGMAIDMHELWIIPLAVLLGMILVFLFFGYSSLVGIVAMLAMSPLLALLARWLSKIETAVSSFRDDRVKTMSEILNGIRIVKFFAMEDGMKEKVHESRSKEYNGLQKGAIVRNLQQFVSVFVSIAGSSVTFICYHYFGGELTISSMFTGLVLFENIRNPLFHYPTFLSLAVSSYVSAKRIGDFLYADELSHLPHDHANIAQLPSHHQSSKEDGYTLTDDSIAIQFKKATITWNDESDAVLKNINLTLKKGKLYCIIGHTGVGKSSLFSTIYGDTIIKEGSLHVHPSSKIALSDENPWMINGSVRDNIIFDKSLPFDHERYQQILDVCQLRDDLEEFQNYDMSEIGYSGINLSLGQKHRISLARACYSNADIILMDSSLNSVDARLCKKIFKECIQDYLKDRTRILITHSLQLLEMADEVIVLDKGTVVAQGHLSAIMHAYDFSKLIRENDEESKTDHPMAQTNDLTSVETNLKTESYVTKNGRENKSLPLSQNESPSTSSSKGKLVSIEEKHSGDISWKVVFNYLKEFGLIVFIICVTTSLLAIGSKLASSLWISLMNMNTFNISIASYVWIYFLLGIIDALIITVRGSSFAFAALKSSNRIHEKMLNGALRAPILFFDQNPVGRILNRFTQDLNATDSEMLFTLANGINTFLNIVLTLVLIAIVTPLFLLVAFPVAVAFYIIQAYYRTASRDIRRLESISKSPVLSHFSSCLNGINTIKALLIHEQIFEENFMKIDFTAKHSHYRYLINRWLGVRIQVVAQVVIFSTAAFSILARHVTPYVSPAFLALSITYSLQLTEHFTQMVRLFVDLESSMTSVERILHYCHGIDREAPTELENDPIPTQWPTQGHVKIENMSVKYRDDLDPVLKSISLDIQPGTKLGLVGRTGSGKSSLLITLFRFIEPFQGSITVDGLNISQIGLKTLRKSLLIIPQQPVLFSGTLRYNLDIFNEFEDYEIWNALERVQLKSKVSQFSLQLNEIVSENGSNFSIGERQLLSLCRCILRKAKIIIFDESTAFVDHKSDALVQKIIREEFKDSTIITVAHRLDTIIDSDAIAVMRNGEIIEYGKPTELLENPQSQFTKLVNETGHKYASHLIEQAFKKQCLVEEQ
ncbi:hypothetical protein C9374_008052 [Naegleria lovaniensis]|uniref:Uncharacterized protein n=1 Tax=Naegleria lovaniensis TaxID=51637 RepID=A0AA88GJZ1_NAELO|nr:uncharacterized protein C9374_008052 [Naegleria lovaniensis]KAG2378904.1 hypothetical protein C9374_008052 [Naegleria lovaniensis]